MVKKGLVHLGFDFGALMVRSKKTCAGFVPIVLFVFKSLANPATRVVAISCEQVHHECTILKMTARTLAVTA